MDLEALPVNSGDLQVQGCMEPEAQARDGGEGDLMMQGGSRLEDTSDFFNTEDGGETVGGGRTKECEGVPSALEDVLREEADAAVADAHGRGGQAIDVFAGQEGVLQFLCRDAVGGWVVELRSQSDCPDRGCLSPLALATELESRKHVLTQWGHEISPFVRCVVRVRRKTS